MSAFRRRLAGLALIGALGASAAQAQSSYPALFSAYTKSAWAAPSVEITQYGRGNGSAAGQNGVDSAIRILQIGRRNDATITQTGVNNSACIVQVGRGSSAGVVQTGGQSVGVIQTRAGSHTFPAVLCEIDPQNPGRLRRAVTQLF
jgi:hypothetical protein